MIYSKSRNFIFLRVPKTASTSIHHQIMDCISKSDITVTTLNGYAAENFSTPINGVSLGSSKKYRVNSHPNLKRMIDAQIIKEEDLNHLNVYGVIRDPIDRIISWAHHYNYEINSKEAQASNDAVVEMLFKVNDSGNIPAKLPQVKQVHWLLHNNKPINKLFRYDQINLVVKELCGEETVRYNHRSEYRTNKTTELSLELQQEVRKEFAEDFALWESLQPPQP